MSFEFFYVNVLFVAFKILFIAIPLVNACQTRDAIVIYGQNRTAV